MKLDEAIEILESERELAEWMGASELIKALNLGISALKHWQEYRARSKIPC